MTTERFALYYPRIHIRDEGWLKATLLAFGRVYRIVPFDHSLWNDSFEVRALSERHGAVAPLVYEIDPEWDSIRKAQREVVRLIDEIGAAEAKLRFGPEATRLREAESEPYAIHRSKIHLSMLEKLRSRGLAWRRDDSAHSTDGEGSFFRVHPDLGEAIMGVSAIAAAQDKGCDVVTDSPGLHFAVSALDEKALLEHVIHRKPAAAHDVTVEMVADRIAHAVFTLNVDLSAVSLDDVAGLVRDGADLRAFRTHLVSFAQRVPSHLHPDERERRVTELADEVVASWNRFHGSLSRRLRSALMRSGAGAAEEISKEAIKALALAGTGVFAGLSGLSAPTVLAVIAPAAVPVAFSLLRGAAALSARGEESRPERYLAQVRDMGGVVLARASL